MNYFINPGALSAVFTVPCKAVDSGLKLASEAQIKVLLYVNGMIDYHETFNWIKPIKLKDLTKELQKVIIMRSLCIKAKFLNMLLIIVL